MAGKGTDWLGSTRFLILAEFIQDQKVETRDQVGGASLALSACLGVKFVHQIDDVEEPASPTFSDRSRQAQKDTQIIAKIV